MKIKAQYRYNTNENIEAQHQQKIEPIPPESSPQQVGARRLGETRDGDASHPPRLPLPSPPPRLPLLPSNAPPQMQGESRVPTPGRLGDFLKGALGACGALEGDGVHGLAPHQIFTVFLFNQIFTVFFFS